MPSPARTTLNQNLTNITELRAAYTSLTGGGRGAPPIANGQRQGAAVTRAGVVLLAASFEAFVEDLFEQCLPYIFPTLTQGQMDALISQSSRRMHNADCAKIEHLYEYASLPNCLDGIQWQRFGNTALRRNINQFVHIRNCIAHGGALTVSKNNNAPFNLVHKKLGDWRRMVENFAPRFEQKISNHIVAITRNAPPW